MRTFFHIITIMTSQIGNLLTLSICLLFSCYNISKYEPEIQIVSTPVFVISLYIALSLIFTVLYLFEQTDSQIQILYKTKYIIIKMSFLKNLVDNVTDYAYNKYNSINNTYKVPSDISELESECWILGKRIPLNEAFTQSSRNPSMGYRSGFCLKRFSFKTDRAQGCTIRAFQTLLAQAVLRHHRIYHPYFKESVYKFLKHFTDETHPGIGPFDFSFETIFCELADRFNLTAVRFFSMEEVATAIEDSHKHIHHHQNGQCTAPFCIRSFKQSQVDFNDILKNCDFEPCKCIPAQFYCKDICHRTKPQKPFKPLLLLVSGIFQDKKAYTRLFLQESIIGGVIGSGEKSFYTFGYYCNKDSMAILDPHRIQAATNINNLKQHYSTFFCQDFKCVPFEELSEAYSLGFYIENIEQLTALQSTTQSKASILYDVNLAVYDYGKWKGAVRMLESNIGESLLNGSLAKSKLQQSMGFEMLRFSVPIFESHKENLEEFILHEIDQDQFIELPVRRHQSCHY